MKLTRRKVLQGTGAGLAALALPRFAIADIDVPGGTVTSVYDGSLMLPRDFILGGLPAEELAPILDKYEISGDQLTPPCNVTLYRDGENTILFDVGSGSEFMPTAGELFGSLDAIGVAPEDVTHVVFTHGHPDHLWGLLDDFGDPAFTEADYLMGEAEFLYWTDPETVNTIDTERQAFAVGAARRLEMIADGIRLFGDGDEVVPGVTALSTPGHTPGHMAFQIGGETAEGLIVTGDAIGNHHVAFAHPEWEVNSDQDPVTGAVTRTAFMGRLAEAQSTILGFHLPDGGLGKVVADGSGYRFERV